MTSWDFTFSGVVLIWVATRLFTPAQKVLDFIKERDSSDPPGEARSHMKVLVDHKTGREYLAVCNMFGFSSITPRLPAERQILVFPSAPPTLNRTAKGSLDVRP